MSHFGPIPELTYDDLGEKKIEASLTDDGFKHPWNYSALATIILRINQSV